MEHWKIGNIGSGEMHEFNETAHLVELEAEDEEEHIHEVLHPELGINIIEYLLIINPHIDTFKDLQQLATFV